MATLSSLPAMSRRLIMNPLVLRRLTSTESGDSTGKPDVNKTPEVTKTPETPKVFDNTKYQAEEYYSYNDMSFYDLENEMSDKRLKQPSKFPQPSA